MSVGKNDYHDQSDRPPPEHEAALFVQSCMKQEVPFTPQNRPWLTPECIEGMNEQWMACISKVPPELREDLRDWAAVKVEMGVCKDDPEAWEACRRWGDEWARQHEARLAETVAALMSKPRG